MIPINLTSNGMNDLREFNFRGIEFPPSNIIEETTLQLGEELQF